MNLKCEVAVVGAGLAGACATLHLSRQREVLLLEANDIAAGASGASAGLINPLTGRRALPVWQMDEALTALRATLDVAEANNLYLSQGVIRPAIDQSQVDRFRRSAEAHPHIAKWFDAAAFHERYPTVSAPHGGLFIHRGGAIDIERFCVRLLEASTRNGARSMFGWRLEQFAEDERRVRATFVSAGEAAIVESDYLIIAPGQGYRELPLLRELDLHRIKGQTVRVRIDDVLPADHPHISGIGYVVNEGSSGDAPSGSLVLGSTYEHEFDDDEPHQRATEEIIAKTQRLLPIIADAEVTMARAGVRVTVPKIRLPMVGPLPGSSRVWIVGGLGSKGLLMAPMIGQQLISWLTSPSAIPGPLRPRQAPKS